MSVRVAVTTTAAACVSSGLSPLGEGEGDGFSARIISGTQSTIINETNTTNQHGRLSMENLQLSRVETLAAETASPSSHSSFFAKKFFRTVRTHGGTNEWDRANILAPGLRLMG